MKHREPSEFEKFDKVMRGLLSVPYRELQSKLEDERKQKAKKREAKKTTSRDASRGSADDSG